MTKEELATRLDGRQYGSEMTCEEEQLAKESNLVVIFGASDDLCEMRGAIDDEFDCYEGGEIECSEYPGKLNSVWAPFSGGSWGYETDLPHAEFNIYEEDTLYCVGIVVDLNECKSEDDSTKTIEPRNGWISVKDRLPEKGQEVLAYDRYNGFIVGSNYGGKIWERGDDLADNVTHWQPLPEPPKGE